MKHSVLRTLVLLIVCCTPALAKDFSISVEPTTQILPAGRMVTYRVFVQPNGGFTSSVFLSVQAPTLNGARLSIVPDILNAPYENSATVSVELPVWPQAGRYDIVIEGENGPLSVRDTVELVVPQENPWKAWRVFNRHNSPIDRLGETAFTLDRRNGIGWFADLDSLYSFDGTNWMGYSWPRSTQESRVCGLALDSTGTIWAIFSKGYSPTFNQSFIVSQAKDV